MNPILIIFVVLSLIVMFLFTYGKRVQMDRLAVLLECGEFEQFDKVADSFLSKLLVRHYDLESAKLNSYILRKDHSKTDQQFERLSNVSQTPQMSLSLYVRAFEYYVYEKNHKMSADYLSKLKELANDEVKEFCQMEYDILILKSTEYIERLNEDVQVHQGQRKAVCLYLLKLSYENAKRLDKVKEIDKQIKEFKM